MKRKIPSTAALIAFETAAKYESFTKAADELAVTQSAISRQITALEEQLGIKLFRRVTRGVVLTEAGASYSIYIRELFDELEKDTLELMASGGKGGTLELSVGPTFCVRWLIPRLRDFSLHQPEITINLSARTRPYLFSETPFDAAIHAGQSLWPGTETQYLMNENLVAVCSPKLISPRKTLKQSDWGAYTLLHPATRPYAWRQWFESKGVNITGDMSGPRYELFSMQVAAAVQCMGIALIPRFLIEEELRTKQLIEIDKHQYQSDRCYYLIFPESKAEKPALTIFRNWIEEVSREYREAILRT